MVLVNRSALSIDKRSLTAVLSTSKTPRSAPGEQVGRDHGGIDPADRFLLFDRPRPNLRVHHAQHGLVIGIDRHHAVAEKPKRLAVAHRPQVAPSAIAGR